MHQVVAEPDRRFVRLRHRTCLARFFLFAPPPRPELRERTHRAVERNAGYLAAKGLIGPVGLPVTP